MVDGVRYLELRTTPRTMLDVTKEEYIHVVLEELKRAEVHNRFSPRCVSICPPVNLFNSLFVSLLQLLLFSHLSLPHVYSSSPSAPN